MKPYLEVVRFDKPIGSWLLFLPCSWSIALAAEPGMWPDVKMMALFGTGAFLMRGAGCIINDMWDKDLDAKVERTKSRPLASGRLTHTQGFSLLGLQLVGSLGVLLALNNYSIALGLSSVGLVVLYPLMKRFTYWPQLVLGLTINWGALLGWAAVHGSCAWNVVLPLYAAGVCWTIIYDTIYAHQHLRRTNGIFGPSKSAMQVVMVKKISRKDFPKDSMWADKFEETKKEFWQQHPGYSEDKVDDELARMRSLALLWQDQTKPYLGGFGVGMIGCLWYTGVQTGQTWPYYLALVGTTVHLGNQIIFTDLNNGSACAASFRSNRALGLILLAGIVFSTRRKKTDIVYTIDS